jgi:hypothetical protein
MGDEKGVFSGLILDAELKQSIWVLEEANFPKGCAVGLTLLPAACFTDSKRPAGSFTQHALSVKLIAGVKCFPSKGRWKSQ